MKKIQCPKCGSSDVSNFFVFESKNHSKDLNFKEVQECNDCRYDWK